MLEVEDILAVLLLSNYRLLSRCLSKNVNRVTNKVILINNPDMFLNKNKLKSAG